MRDLLIGEDIGLLRRRYRIITAKISDYYGEDIQGTLYEQDQGLSRTTQEICRIQSVPKSRKEISSWMAR